jgi:hypothetical protein
VPIRDVWIRRVVGLFAVILLDVSLTFRNVWPTPAVRWEPAISIELTVVVLVMAAAAETSRRLSRGGLRWLAGGWLLLVLGRYEYVTAAALFGRELNLYFDVRFLPAVTAMLARAAPTRTVILVAGAAVLSLTMLYAALRWALGRLQAMIEDRGARRTVAAVAAAVLVIFAGQQLGGRASGHTWFMEPVTDVYARQLRIMVDALRRTRALPPSPAMDSNLAFVRGADVLLIFVESYGAVSYERPELARGIDASRREFGRAVHDTGRDVVTAYVESPTFGGNSWLAHITLLSGIEVRDLDTSHLLMMQQRGTLVKTFTRHGYRAIAMMPGQRELWPEGTFYGFDDIYGADRLDYRGPPFGWFTIPDQFSLARLDALEPARAGRAPLFVFFPTLSTHTPFEPIPPYQPDWSRMLSDHPYDSTEAARALAREPNWGNLGASYVDAVAYEFATFAGYLRAHADRDFVMILIGDHQPPAVVSGEGAPWDVPVHVVARRPQVLDRLVAHGFRRGVDAVRPSLGKMQALLPVVLEALGGSGSD